MNTYIIDDGQEYNAIQADGFSVDTNGRLYLSVNQEGTTAVFAPGTWRSCLLKNENGTTN